MTNEEAFKISKQPAPTCPVIDSLEDELNEIRGHIERIKAWGQNWQSFLDKQLHRPVRRHCISSFVYEDDAKKYCDDLNRRMT